MLPWVFQPHLNARKSPAAANNTILPCRYRGLDRLDLDIAYQRFLSPRRNREIGAYLKMQRYERKDESFEVLDKIVEDTQAFRIG